MERIHCNQNFMFYKFLNLLKCLFIISKRNKIGCTSKIFSTALFYKAKHRNTLKCSTIGKLDKYGTAI